MKTGRPVWSGSPAGGAGSAATPASWADQAANRQGMVTVTSSVLHGPAPDVTPTAAPAQCPAGAGGVIKPVLAAVEDGHQRQHHRHLDQHADHRGRAAPDSRPNSEIATATAKLRRSWRCRSGRPAPRHLEGQLQQARADQPDREDAVALHTSGTAIMRSPAAGRRWCRPEAEQQHHGGDRPTTDQGFSRGRSPPPPAASGPGLARGHAGGRAAAPMKAPWTAPGFPRGTVMSVTPSRKAAIGAKANHHDQVVHRHLDQRVTGVALTSWLHEDHRGAGATPSRIIGDVLAGRLRSTTGRTGAGRTARPAPPS